EDSTLPMFSNTDIACVTRDADGKGEFLWQKSPCNLKMANAI
ncbi:phosphohistidine phosphatase, partial [Klebsiella pneumoniae]